MKNTFYLFLFAFIFSSGLKAQLLPNADFELWETVGSYADPVSWNSLNPTLSPLGIITSGPSNDAHSGLQSARLETKSVFGTPVPGILTLGQLEVDVFSQTTSMTGGIPCTTRPSGIKGYYQYSPLPGDSCVLLCYLTRYIEENGEPDTIATGFFFSGTSTTAWQPFEIMMEYERVDVPDTFNLFIVSSASANSQEGTVLWVDDIEWDYSGDHSVFLGNDTVLTAGQSLFLDAGAGVGYTYEWHKDGELAVLSTSQNLTVTETGSFSVIVRNVYGLPALDTIQVQFVSANSFASSKQNWRAGTMVQNGNLTLSAPSKSPIHFQVMNPVGQITQIGSISNPSNNEEVITISSLSGGMYFLIVWDAFQRQSFRFLVPEP